jgi:hypothetical protein
VLRVLLVVDAAFLLGSVPTLECGLGILLVSDASASTSCCCIATAKDSVAAIAAYLLCFRWEDTASGLLVVAAVGGVSAGVVVAILSRYQYTNLDDVYRHHVTIVYASIQHPVWSTYDEFMENNLHVTRYQQ